MNRKLHKLTKDMHHVSVTDTNLARNDFTRHGLHMNSAGKDKIAKIIRHKITNLLTSQIPPISLKWKKVPSATSTIEEKVETISGNAENVHKNAARASCRTKKTTITRNEDFFMGNVHIKNSVVDVGVRSGYGISCKQNWVYKQNIRVKNSSE